jgi:ubiquinone/menaquinone biosynthesis C-methylase UbiE
MKLNWAERWVVNNLSRILQQRIEIQWLKRMVILKPGAIALELGCGRGAGAKLILKAFQPSHLYILDLDLQMIKKARVYLSPKIREQIFSLVGDAFSLPFGTETFDVIFGFGFLHHVPDWRTAVAEIARVLKTSGIYCIEEIYPSLYQNFITKRILLHPEHDRFNSQDLHSALKEVNMPLRGVLEVNKIGILGVAVKSDH